MLTVNYDGQRRKLTLGKISKSDANRFSSNIRYLQTFKKHHKGTPVELESWIQSLSNRHVEQLGEIGLLGKSDFKMTVRELVESFLKDYKSRSDVQESTKRQFENALKRFPARLLNKLVVDIEPKKDHHRTNAKPVFSESARSLFRTVESWQREHYSKATWSKANGRIRQVGHWAVEVGICDFNPFSLLPKPGEQNADRNVYVEVEWIDDTLEMCLDPDTRLVIALGRFAGIRTPSEARTIKPKDVDFEKSQLHIFDSKKRKYRTMPLFKRVRDELERHRDEAGWDRFVFTERFRRQSDANNFNLIKEAIARTQWDPWAKIRQNLRTSCENDLLRMGFDERLVTEWLGHTVKISRKHYQKQTDSDYQTATEKCKF